MAPLFLADPLSARALAAVRRSAGAWVTSGHARDEVRQVIARQLGLGALTAGEADSARANFAQWRARAAATVEITSSDLLTAFTLVKRKNLDLPAALAVHLGVVWRLGLALCTFDARLSAAAKAAGIRLAA